MTYSPFLLAPTLCLSIPYRFLIDGGSKFIHGWDGTFNGQIAPNAVYVYMAEVTFIDGKTEIFTGDLTLAR